MSEETKNRLELTKNLKARLLNTILKGYIDLDEFPEITTVINQGKTGYWFLPYTPEAEDTDK